MSVSTVETATTTQDVVLSDLDRGVLLLTWNRPERNNGWTIDLEEAYFAALIAAANDSEVRVIVVTGAGRSFCPGLDLQDLGALTGGTPMASRRRWPLNLVRHIPKPVIAAVNGACAGIGLVQAVACDLRFASTSAKFTSAFARRGLPAENSISWMLPRLVGTANAMDLLLSARVVMPPEALQMGLVNRLVDHDDLLPATLEYARDLAASCSPRAMAAIKRQVLDDWEHTSEESRMTALVEASELVASDDFVEGVASFREKRVPKFGGLAAEVSVPRGWYR
jgi:enoyl-CoA hydratase/carnithine racemase